MYPPKRKVNKSPSVPRLPALNGSPKKVEAKNGTAERRPAKQAQEVVPPLSFKVTPSPAPVEVPEPVPVVQPAEIMETVPQVPHDVARSHQLQPGQGKRQHKSFTSNIEFGDALPPNEMFQTEYRNKMTVSRNSRPVPAPKVFNLTYKTTIQLSEPADYDPAAMTSVYRGDFNHGSMSKSPSAARLSPQKSPSPAPASPARPPGGLLEPVHRTNAVPGQVICFCCSNSFPTSALERHINNCLSDRMSTYRAIPSSLRPALPKAPSRLIPGANATARELADYNQEALYIYETHTAACPHCKSRFPANVFPDHLKNCTGAVVTSPIHKLVS